MKSSLVLLILVECAAVIIALGDHPVPWEGTKDEKEKREIHEAILSVVDPDHNWVSTWDFGTAIDSEQIRYVFPYVFPKSPLHRVSVFVEDSEGVRLVDAFTHSGSGEVIRKKTFHVKKGGMVWLQVRPPLNGQTASMAYWPSVEE